VENFVLGCLLVAAAAFVAVAARLWLGRPAERRKEGLHGHDAPTAEQLLDAIEEEDGEETVEDRLKALERNLRMLTGRVNKVSPPRLGTGEPKAAANENPGNGQDLGRPMSRAELYAQLRRARRGNAR
jgi:hypothetical protein